MIQDLSVTFLYLFDSDFTINQYIYFDLVILFPLAFTMNLSQPADKLFRKQPIHKLLGLPVLFSVLGQICLVLFFQAMSLGILMSYSWYISNTELNSIDAIQDATASSYENNVNFNKIS